MDEQRKRKKRRPFSKLILIAFFVLAILVIWPGTRWIVSRQLRTATFTGSLPGDTRPIDTSDAALATIVAASHPRDFSLQLAAALHRAAALPNDPGGSLYLPKYQEIAKLRSSFSDRPEFYATMLRYSDFLRVDFPEEGLLSGKEGHSRRTQITLSTKEEIEEALELSIAGEKLDTDNAMFPFCRAWMLLALHRTDEALNAIKRAGACNSWNDYVSEEGDGRITLSHTMFGPPDAVHTLAMRASIMYPHYARMRQTARVVVYRVIEAETRGQNRDGAVMRSSLMRYGSLMRTHSRTNIGSLVGIAISHIAMTRPGGAPATKLNPNDRRTGDERAQERIEAYLSYLQQFGSTSVSWTQRQLEDDRLVKGIVTDNLNGGPEDGYKAVIRAAMPWSVGLLIVCNALLVLGLGAMAWFAAKWKQPHLTVLAQIVSVIFAMGVAVYYVRTLGQTKAASMWWMMKDNWQASSGLDITWYVLAGSVPVLLLLIIGLVSIACKVKPSTGIGRGLRGLSVPVATGLAVAFAICVIMTAKMNAHALDLIAKQSVHEGRFIAGSMGREWPGPPSPLPELHAGLPPKTLAFQERITKAFYSASNGSPTLTKRAQP